MIDILLADDHLIIRKGLKLFIENYIKNSVIDEAWDGESTFKKIKEKDYLLIVLDVNMPNTEAFGLVDNIIAIKPDSNILIFSMNAELVYAKKFLQLGAKGYLSKGAPEIEIKKALDIVMSGKKYISPPLIDAIAKNTLRKKSSNPFENLSLREFEIVLHLIKGESIAEICKILALESSTVGTHKARIFKKLNCDNIIDLHALAKVYDIVPNG